MTKTYLVKDYDMTLTNKSSNYSTKPNYNNLLSCQLTWPWRTKRGLNPPTSKKQKKLELRGNKQLRNSGKYGAYHVHQ